MSAAVETIEAMERPPVTMASRLEGELLEVSMGPQHPSTHGVFRMNVALDGEIVRKLKPVFGYLHRNHEKIGERNGGTGGRHGCSGHAGGDHHEGVHGGPLCVIQHETYSFDAEDIRDFMRVRDDRCHPPGDDSPGGFSGQPIAKETGSPPFPATGAVLRNTALPL